MENLAVQKLREQQSKVKERSAPWMVAEQLMDICRRDLESPEMGIVQAEQKIKAFADAHKTGNFSCVTPVEAEGILRKFYGLPEPDAGRRPRGAVSVNLADFLG